MMCYNAKIACRYAAEHLNCRIVSAAHTAVQDNENGSEHGLVLMALTVLRELKVLDVHRCLNNFRNLRRSLRECVNILRERFSGCSKNNKKTFENLGHCAMEDFGHFLKSFADFL